MKIELHFVLADITDAGRGMITVHVFQKEPTYHSILEKTLLGNFIFVGIEKILPEVYAFNCLKIRWHPKKK